MGQSTESHGMNKKTTNSIDRSIGRQIRLRRLAARFSQESLGDRIGMSFRQVQKYENGTNRVTASRLIAIAQTLVAPIEAFFDFQHRRPGSDAFLKDADTRVLLRHYSILPGSMQEMVLHLFAQVNERQEDDDSAG
jgi:transcriptional regulator with XRE-family HTH domain